MQQYIGTKLIQAEPMEKEGEEGYKVCYPDGYVSWSPKATFEEAYRPTVGMTFGLALEAIQKGHKCTRANWNGKGQYITYHPGIPPAVYNDHQPNQDEVRPFIILKTVDGSLIYGWLASQSDMLCSDWLIVD